MSETILDDDYGALAEFAETQEKTMIQNLINEELDSQNVEDPGQSEMVEKYKEYLTFKVYGKGAFGEVTEFYDIINREKVAKKVFTNITDYKVEKDVMTRIDEALGKQLSEDIILGVSKYDAKNQTIFYRAGNCNLADLCNKRREQNIYWFNNEKELLYIATTLFDYVIKMADKNVYHSDLKPVNTCWIYNDKGIEQYDLKLIDMGGATFHWNYLVAITPTYFPESDIFNANENQERRTKAEIYQVGRILQEVCLSSIYAKSHHIYCKTQFKTYKDFIKYYMQNIQQFRDESLQLIKYYYSEDIYQLVKNLLDYNETVESGKTKLNTLRNMANTTFRDLAELIKLLESQKMNQMFESIERSEDKLDQELAFYLQFDFDERGLQRVKDEIKRKYEEEYDMKQFSQFPLLAFYEAIFYTRNQQSKESVFLKSIKEWQDRHYFISPPQNDELEKNDKFMYWDRAYDESTTVHRSKREGYQGNMYDEIKLAFKSPQITEEFKLQFFCEVVGKTAHFDEYLDKQTIENIITFLGFDDEDSPYESVISKYQKFFQYGSSQIYNDSIVKKTIKGLQSFIDEAETEEKKNIFRSFIFQIKCLFVEACYKKMDDAIKNNLDVLGNIEYAIQLFKEIKKSDYGKQMQFLLLAKGFYLLKKFEIENDKNKKSDEEKQTILKEVKQSLEQCSNNMVRVGSQILKYEKNLYIQLSKLSDQLDNQSDTEKYECLAMQKEFQDRGLKNIDSYHFRDLIVGKQWEIKSKEEANKRILQFYKEYFDNTDQWSGYLLANKQYFLSLRAQAYKSKLRYGDFEDNTDKQGKGLKGYSFTDPDGPLALFQMNALQTSVRDVRQLDRANYNRQLGYYLIKWLKEHIEAEQKNDKEIYTKQFTSDYEKEKYFDIFTCNFKLDYLKFIAHQQMYTDYKEAYDVIDYLRDKYIDYPKKQNDITITEMYLAAQERNEKKFKKSQKELDKDELTPSQKHQIQILNEYKEKHFKNELHFIDQDPKYYNKWQCRYCDKDLQYFENKNYFETRHKELRCNCCNEYLHNTKQQYAYPCYGCECQKSWRDNTNKCEKVAIMKNGKMETLNVEYYYFRAYYVCLKCISYKKSPKCEECSTQLKRIKDPYNNYHLIDGQQGFCCKLYKYNNQCYGRKQQHAYCCPNPKCTSQDKENTWVNEYKPHENRYTKCVLCINKINSDNGDEPAEEKNIRKQKFEDIKQYYEQIKENAKARQEIYENHNTKYKGYDFKLVYEIFDNKYGKDWQKYYKEELNYKKNSSKRPKNSIKYLMQQIYPYKYPFKKPEIQSKSKQQQKQQQVLQQQQHVPQPSYNRTLQQQEEEDEDDGEEETLYYYQGIEVVEDDREQTSCCTIF